MKTFNEFKVTGRSFSLGKGYITVIDNKNNIPIDADCVIVDTNKALEIKNVEGNDRLLTNEETVGDMIMIWRKNIKDNCGKNSQDLVIKL